MSCSSRVKTSFGVTSDLVVHEVLDSDVLMHEIFLLLPPETVYKLILVSKRWLHIISCDSFRRAYVDKWKPSSHLMGFFIWNSMYIGRCVVRRPTRESTLVFLSTSSLDDLIESYNHGNKLGYYIDSSNGVLLCGRHPNNYYLWDLNTEEFYQIPCPRPCFKDFCMSLITEGCLDKGFTYKVVRAECDYSDRSKNVGLATYSSQTLSWSYTKLICSETISLIPYTQGRVIQGVLYWHASGGNLAIYDSNDKEKKISLMKSPTTFDYDRGVLGESYDGCLQYGCSNKSEIALWKLEKVGGKLQWNIQHKVRFREIWKYIPNYFVGKFNTLRPESQLLAFLNLKSNSVYIRFGSSIFICDLSTKMVEEVFYRREKSSISWDFYNVSPFFKQCWPSSLQRKKRNN